MAAEAHPEGHRDRHLDTHEERRELWCVAVDVGDAYRAETGPHRQLQQGHPHEHRNDHLEEVGDEPDDRSVERLVGGRRDRKRGRNRRRASGDLP